MKSATMRAAGDTTESEEDRYGPFSFRDDQGRSLPGSGAEGSGSVRDEISNEAATACMAPPPCFNSEAPAGISRFPARAFLLALALLAGTFCSARQSSAQTQSSNADLIGVTISCRGTTSAPNTCSASIRPTPWNAATTSYSIHHDNATRRVALTPTAADSGATITVDGTTVVSGSTSSFTSLPALPHFRRSWRMRVRVTAADGTTTKTYTFELGQGVPSRDAFLGGISVMNGTGELTLGRPVSGGAANVGFARAATAYTVRVPPTATSVTVTPRTSDPRSTVRITVGTSAAQTVTRTNDRLAPTTANLASGLTSSTQVSIAVTAEDGTTTKTYTVTVTKSQMRVEIVPARIRVAEGSTAQYTVSLTSAPAGGNVVVTPSIPSGDSGVATVTAALTFTPTDWSAKTVTVSGVDDGVHNDGGRRRTTITHAVSGGGYDGAVAASVGVTVTDDDIVDVMYIDSELPIGRVEADETAGKIDFNVRLIRYRSPPRTVRMSWGLWQAHLEPGEIRAIPEEDYSGPTSGTLTFLPEEDLKTISVPTYDDFVPGGDRVFSVYLFHDGESDSDFVSLPVFATKAVIKDGGPPIAESPEGFAGTGDGLSVSGGEVTEGDSGSTARATFTVGLSPASGQAVSVSYATSDGTASARSDYESAAGTVTFSPGETSKKVAVTVNGDDEGEGNETFTLSLVSSPNGRIDPQGSSARAVIVNDDEAIVTAEMAGEEFAVGDTTVMVDSTLAADTGLEVALPPQPRRGGSAIGELTVTMGPTDARIDADVFGYTGRAQDHTLVDIDVSPVPDDGVRVCLPITEGLRRAAGGQRLYLIRFSGGAWEELSSATEGETVCAEVSGFSPFALVFDINYAKRRVGEVSRAILPEFSRAMTASTLDAVTSRIDDAMSGRGTTANALNAAPSSVPGREYMEPGLRLGEFEDGETLSLTDAVDGSYHSVSLAQARGYEAPLGESGMEGRVPASRLDDLGMWISGDYRSLSGKGGGLADWDGRLISGHLGADYRFRRNFLAGIAMSWSHGSFDYTGRGEGSARVSGDYRSRMNSFHPYFGFSPYEKLNLWASAGWGFGNIRIDDGEIADRQKASTRMRTIATGADFRLLDDRATDLFLRGEAWISRVKVNGNGEHVEELRVKTNRLRATLEGSRALSLGAGSSLVPSLEFGLRRDGGDGQTGVGGELGGGIAYVSAWGLAVEARGRGLLFHQGDSKEWGLGGSVRYEPGGDERGLSMSVLPSWGDSSSGVRSLWESESAADIRASGSRREFGLETEVGYGFPALGDRGLLTPYGAFGRYGGDGRSYRAGSRLSVGRTFDVSLEGLRRELGADGPEHGLTVQGRLNW